MGKMPYIPLYIGDWEKDTNCLTLEAEGALLKLIFKMWDAPEKGRLIVGFFQLSILLKKSEENAKKIVSELHENGILNVEFLENNKVKFESRRLLKELSKSLAMRDNGLKGGRPKKQEKKQIKSKSKAKAKQIPDNDIDNVYDNDIEIKGGAGENIAADVIEHLNRIADRELRTDNKVYQDQIRARLNDGYTKAELFEIIEIKTAEWKGTDFEKFLQPDTLFNRTKANKYRAQVAEAKRKGHTISQIRGGKVRLTGEELATEAMKLYRAKQA